MAKIVYQIALCLFMGITAVTGQDLYRPEFATNKVKELHCSEGDIWYYDPIGRLHMEKHYWKFDRGINAWSTIYTYDVAGNLFQKYTTSTSTEQDTALIDTTMINFIYLDGNLSREITTIISPISFNDTTAYYSYDNLGNLTESILKEGELINKLQYFYGDDTLIDSIYKYDNLEIQWGLGTVYTDTLFLKQATAYIYNNLGLLIYESPAGYASNHLPFKQFTYDENGSPTLIQENLGFLGACEKDTSITYEKTTNEYSNNRLIRSTIERSINNKLIIKDIQKYKYNKAGLLTKEVYITYVYSNFKWRILKYQHRDCYRYHYEYYK